LLPDMSDFGTGAMMAASPGCRASDGAGGVDG
jgi:hypothetical protein